MKNTFFRILNMILVLCFLAFSNSGMAANAWLNGTIVRLIVHDNGSSDYPGTVQVLMNGAPTWSPSCASAYQQWFVIDLSRPTAKSQYSFLLAAKLAGKPVTVQTNDACMDGMALVRNVGFLDDK